MRLFSVTTSGHSRLSKGLDVDRNARNVKLYFWSPCDPLNVTSFYKKPQVAPNVGVWGFLLKLCLTLGSPNVLWTHVLSEHLVF